MVKLIVKNVRTKIEGELSNVVSKALDEALSYFVDGYFFSPKYKARVWDGKVHRYSEKSQCFDTGCLSLVCKLLKSFNIKWELVDKRKYVAPGTPLSLHNIELRDYQEEALQALLEKSRGLLLMCTGGGKSAIICALMAKLNLSTIVYVHTIDLLEQMQENMRKFLNTEPGQIGNGIVDIKHFTVAMMQTVCKALVGKYVKYEYDPTIDYDDPTILDAIQKQQIVDRVKEVEMVVYDECHHLSNNSLQTIARNSKNAYYRYGVSATLREDGADVSIYGATGSILYKKTASELIEAPLPGPYLTRPTIYFYYVPPNPNVLLRNGKWQKVYKNNIVERVDRNELIVKSAMKLCVDDKTCLILVKQIKHGKILLDLFKSGIACDWKDINKSLKSDDLRVEFIQGRLKKDERIELLNQTREKKIDVLVATSLPWEERVLIREKGYVRCVQIGKFIDRYLNREGVKTIKNIEILSIDNSKKSCWRRVTHVSKHLRKNRILEVETKRGQLVRVTENHSLISPELKPVLPKERQEILNANRISLEGRKKSLDLIDLFTMNLPKEELNRVRVELLNLTQVKRRLLKSEWRFLKGDKQDWSTKNRVRQRLKKIKDLDSYKKFLEWFWTYVQYKRGRGGTCQYSCSIYEASLCPVFIEQYLPARIYYHRSRTVVFLPLQMEITQSLIKLLGYYVSEGSKGCYGKRKKWTLTIAAHEETAIKKANKYKGQSLHDRIMRWKGELRQDAKRCLVDVFGSKAIKESRSGIHCECKLVYLFLTYVIGCTELAQNKEIPDLVFNLSPSLRKDFLNAFLRGDGHYSEKQNRICFITSSYSSVCGLQYLLKSLGLSSFLYKKKKEQVQKEIDKYNKIEGRANFDIYYLHCSDKNYKGPLSNMIQTQSTERTDCDKLPIKTMTDITIDQKYVYDFSVEDTERFVAGTGICVHNTLADEGLDLPALDAVILAGGGKSYVKAFQRVGRALRLYPGKTKAYVIDFYDDSKYLRKHSNRRIKLYKEEPAFILKIQKKKKK